MASQISASNGFKEENARAGHSASEIQGGFSEAPEGPGTNFLGPPAANRHRLPPSAQQSPTTFLSADMRAI